MTETRADRAARAARKEKQAREAPENMARYRQEQQATLDKTARLRAQRLALPEMKSPASSMTKRATRRSLPGLQQGVRG
jgi:hypothetical protein